VSKERLSSSKAAHRRQVLAEERRKPEKLLMQGIREKVLAEKRIVEVEQLLNSKGKKTTEILPKDKVSLEIELIWLKFRLERITPAERQSLLQKKLNALEQESPEIFNWLTTEAENGFAPLARIRDSVMPPIEIKGYHTKRR